MKISLMALVAGFGLVVGLPLAATAGPTPGSGTDVDVDGIEDAFDNCTNDTTSAFEANPAQIDFDHDGCGNRCDADYNQTGLADGGDFILFKNSFLCAKNPGPGFCPAGTGPGQYNGNVDSDGNELIDGGDFIFFKDRVFKPLGPGPSGMPASQRDTTIGSSGNKVCPP